MRSVAMPELMRGRVFANDGAMPVFRSVMGLPDRVAARSVNRDFKWTPHNTAGLEYSGGFPSLQVRVLIGDNFRTAEHTLEVPLFVRRNPLVTSASEINLPPERDKTQGLTLPAYLSAEGFGTLKADQRLPVYQVLAVLPYGMEGDAAEPEFFLRYDPEASFAPGSSTVLLANQANLQYDLVLGKRPVELCFLPNPANPAETRLFKATRFSGRTLEQGLRETEAASTMRLVVVPTIQKPRRTEPRIQFDIGGWGGSDYGSGGGVMKGGTGSGDSMFMGLDLDRSRTRGSSAPRAERVQIDAAPTAGARYGTVETPGLDTSRIPIVIDIGILALDPRHMPTRSIPRTLRSALEDFRFVAKPRG